MPSNLSPRRAYGGSAAASANIGGSSDYLNKPSPAVTEAGPTRNDSVLSKTSSAYSSYSTFSDQSYRSGASAHSALSAYGQPYPVTATQSSPTSALAGQKRDVDSAGMSPQKARGPRLATGELGEPSPATAYRNARAGLRPLPQAPNGSGSHNSSNISVDPTKPPNKHDNVRHDAEHEPSWSDSPTNTPVPPPPRFGLDSSPRSRNVSGHRRAESVSTLSVIATGSPGRLRETSHQKHHSLLSTPDLSEFQGSSTKELRTLARMTQDSSEDFSPTFAPSVVGLQNRRQLKRTDSVRGAGFGKEHGAKVLHGSGGAGTTRLAAGINNGLGGSTGLQRQRPTSTWAANNWMDQQRKFIQAYEYLCHIGEAKEWIEDIIHKPIPPIVQLEEALRDGVTLAEVVQALYPEQRIRLFINPKLQFRHSDNIAVFFRFLDEVALPDVFRFELTDLYEKKNIPKVIYCIHALSWLLFKMGMVDFKISSLVGHLQFEDHELEETQKGLDKAGVNMPSFAGMGASFGAEPEPEPEPEPQETDEERIQRELAEHEASVADFQSQIRGCLLRLRLGRTMQGLWDAEDRIVELQSRLRGEWSRQIFDYRLGMQHFAINLQSAARGFIVRYRQSRSEQRWKSMEPQVVLIQSLSRARKARQEVSHIRTMAASHSHGVKQLQAAIRGALQRRAFDQQYDDAQRSQQVLPSLQAAVRGMLTRKAHHQQKAELRLAQHGFTKLQGAIRGMQARSDQTTQTHLLEKSAPAFANLQAAVRGLLARKVNHGLKEMLNEQTVDISGLQAKIRGDAVRNSVMAIKAELQSATPDIIALQTEIRGSLSRLARGQEALSLERSEDEVIRLQSHIRAVLSRAKHQALTEELESHAEQIVSLQALTRAMTVRMEVGSLLEDLDQVEGSVEHLQAFCRAALLRARFAEKQRYFRENMEKVIKVQSFVRGKLQGQAYKSLTSGKNPPVNTVKNFVHLLNDSDLDFDEEIEFERLRKTVVQHVRQNEAAGDYIAQLDIKIALLVKNKITLDEVVKHQKHFGGHMGGLLHSRDLSSKDPFDLKALNKNSRRKLEQYQEFFFILQTQPQYLARLFRKIREQAVPEKEAERVKHLVMGTFGYAQKRREEYYLLKLLARSIKEEIDNSQDLAEYLRSKCFWQKIFGAYSKSPRDRKYLRDVIAPVIKDNVLDEPDLDLESDPLQIYRAAIDNEQLRTGRRSSRPLEVTREEAIRDPETKQAFIAHLQDLRGICDQLLGAVHDLMHKMPFGLRYLSQQMYHSLANRYPYEEKLHVLQVVGHWVWRNYLHPALTEPEKLGIVDRGLMPEQKKNLAEVAKVLAQIAAGKLFGQENVFLQPLNSYVGEAIEQLTDTWKLLLDVRTAESQFDIDEFNDLYAKTKPTLYIKMADVLAIHSLIAQDTRYICPDSTDALRDLVRELGNVKSNESELSSVGTSEICLTLNPKLHEKEDPDAKAKTLWMESKRCILYIIRVQSGANLKEIMVKPITVEDEEKWAQLVREELSTTSRRRGAYSDANNLIDLASLTYAQLKMVALENIIQLQQFGRLTQHNNYQDLLNAIAVDIRTKHRRRIQRQRELEGVRMTLHRLDEQSEYLEQQLKTYNDYIEQAMVTLQNKKGKKRFVMPFTKQWDHERELARTGRVPKFGSYKYSAAELANRGILVAWGPYPERSWGSLDLTISSNEVGVFTVDGSSGSIAMPGASAQLPLDDLLQAQYNNTQFMEFFGGEKVKVNVNLFLHLIMRKFYKDRE